MKLQFLVLIAISILTLSSQADDADDSSVQIAQPPLPAGIYPNKIHLSVYPLLPGIQPPTISYDGHDLSAEALSMIQGTRTPVLLPGMPTSQQPTQPFPTGKPVVVQGVQAAPSPSAAP